MLSLEDYAELQNNDLDEYLRLVRGFNDNRLASVGTLQQNGVNIARLSASLVAFITEGNVDLAADQANLSFSNHAEMAQRYNVLANINLLEDYQRLSPLIKLQEQLVQAAGDNIEIANLVQQFKEDHPDLFDGVGSSTGELLGHLKNIASNSGYAGEFSDLRSIVYGHISISNQADGLEDFAVPYAPDDASYWAQKVASLDLPPSMMDKVKAGIDDHFALKFGTASCGNVETCVEASALIKSLLILSDVDDLRSEAQQYYDTNRPLIVASGDESLLHAFDSTFAYFSAATEFVVEFGGGYASAVENGSAALFVMSGMIAHSVTDGAHGQLEYMHGAQAAVSAAETTAYIAENYESLPGAAKDVWDGYSAQIDERKAAGDTFAAEKLRSKRYMVVGSMIWGPGPIISRFGPDNMRPLRDQITDLSPSERALVDSVETFKTHGVSNADALHFIQETPEGQKLFDLALSSAGPDADVEVVLRRAAGYIETGVALPKMKEIDFPLLKIVPTGGNLSGFSPFFTTQKQLDLARQSGKPLSDVFGLPAVSDGDRFGVFEIKPKSSAIVFESIVAPTSELEGKLTTRGGGVQIIVPDRSQFEQPTLIEVIDDNFWHDSLEQNL